MKNKVLKGSVLAGGSGSRMRVPNDYYATPPYATNKLLDALNSDGITLEGSILEPSCGGGHISDVLISRYGLDRVYSFDLVDRGYQYMNGVSDFIEDPFPVFDNIITNPPFKLAEKFIRKSLLIANDKVIMLCRIQLLEGIERNKMFKDTPLRYVYVHSSRVSTLRNGEEFDENGKKWASTLCLAWFIWEQGYKGEPVIRWIK